ncbi:MAG TPA: PHP domain-containing protein [Casimicrobiaceae bacterium]|nr:PHP domain-containing protein [Casimicrobiaceae bacterium]
MPIFDLHAHSTESDGMLTPTQLVERAAQRGVDVLALTDHDTVSGLSEAGDAARRLGVELVAGCEISVTWESLTIHVVGLRIDPDNVMLREGLAGIRAGRDQRARKIGAALEHAGVPRAYEGARAYATRDDLVSRTHFARFLVQCGAAPDIKRVFKRFLAPGKPGYVPHPWPSLVDAVSWVRAAGGQAVLAHPGRYPATRTRMRRLLGDFCAAGGDALEALSPAHTARQYVEYATLARVFDLKVSQGSDYHAPGESWIDLGGLPPMPAGAVAVWQHW